MDGRYRWQQGILAASTLWGVLSIAISACGGRTSSLDPEIYTANPGGGSSSMLPAMGGRGGSAGQVSVGGSAPIAGKGGAGPGKPRLGAVDTSLAIVPCEKYCPGFGTQCADRVMGPDCMSACQGETNGFGPQCQKLAIQSLTCLTPFFTPGGSNCDEAVARGLEKCGDIVDQFEKCKAVVSGQPTPPSPAPAPGGSP